MTWLQAFTLTEVVEVTTLLLWWSLVCRARMDGSARPMDLCTRRWGWRIGAAATPSAMTHPILWNAVLHVLQHGAVCPSPITVWCYLGIVLPLEACVVVAEGIILRALGAPRPFLSSWIANGASAGLGFLLR